MTSGAMDEKLETVLRKHIQGADVDARFPKHADLTDLGLDSLKTVNLLLDLEDAFAIRFPDSMLEPETFRTAWSLQNAIWDLRNGSQ